MLLHLSHGYTPELVRDALAAKIKTRQLSRAPTDDHGDERHSCPVPRIPTVFEGAVRDARTDIPSPPHRTSNPSAKTVADPSRPGFAGNRPTATQPSRFLMSL